MRKFIPITLGIVGVFLFTAFTTISTTSFKSQQHTKVAPLVYKIMEVTYLWGLLDSSHEVNRETDDTWLDVGLRHKYAIAKKYISLELLEELTGTKVFNRGPHGSTLDFNSTYSFGYYNPMFLQILRENIATALENPTFKTVAAKAFIQYFERAANTYRNAYLYLQANPEELQRVRRNYLEIIAQPQGTTKGSLQEVFRGYSDDAVKKDKEDWYESVTAPSFWVRRSIDGTDEQLFDILDMLIDELGAKS